MEILIQAILNAILLGGFYALIAIGLSSIMGIVRVMNFGHGELMILGSYLGLVITTYLHINPFLALIIIIPVMYAVGYLLQMFLINRALKINPEAPTIVTFGLSIVLQSTFLMLFSPNTQNLPTSLSIKVIHLGIGELTLPAIYLLDFGVALLVMLAMQLFYKTTFLGRAIRAASDDPRGAEYMGINTKKIYAIAMGISMITAGIAGLLLGTTFTFYPYTGGQFLFVAFGAAIIGGLGNMAGTFLAGIILAMGQILGATFSVPGCRQSAAICCC